jgi:hypothetical protein
MTNEIETYLESCTSEQKAKISAGYTALVNLHSEWDLSKKLENDLIAPLYNETVPNYVSPQVFFYSMLRTLQLFGVSSTKDDIMAMMIAYYSAKFKDDAVYQGVYKMLLNAEDEHKIV